MILFAPGQWSLAVIDSHRWSYLRERWVVQLQGAAWGNVFRYQPAGFRDLRGTRSTVRLVGDGRLSGIKRCPVLRTPPDGFRLNGRLGGKKEIAASSFDSFCEGGQLWRLIQHT